MDLADRVAVVTGAARGIGKAAARQLAEVGAIVGIVDLNQADVDAACAELAASLPGGGAGRVAGFACDVSDPDAVDTLFRKVKQTFGRLDILVNNAGITRDNLFSRMTFEQWKRVIDVNLTGTFLCSRHAIPLIRKSPCGRIINLSSVAARGNIGQANYAASKAGVVGFTKTLAIELGRYGVTANAIAPGFIDTEMTQVIPDKYRQHWIDQIPLGRAGTPEDVAAAVVFLASDDASYLSGQVLQVDGGMNTPAEVSASIDPSK